MTTAYGMLILSQVLLGSVAVAARWADLPAEWVTLFRCIFAATGLAAWMLVVRQHIDYRALREHLVPLLLTGACMGVNWLLFFEAMLVTTISKAILLYNLAPFFVVVSAMVFLREVPTVRQAVCLLAALGGVAVVTATPAGLHLQWTDAYVILAALFYAQVTVLARRLKQIPAPLVALAQTTIAALVVLPMAATQGSVQVTAATWPVLVVLGVGLTAVPYLLYFEGLKHVSASIAGILQGIYTLSTIVCAVLAFDEPVTHSLVLGGSIILGATYITLRHPGHRPLTDLWTLEAARRMVAKATQ